MTDQDRRMAAATRHLHRLSLRQKESSLLSYALGVVLAVTAAGIIVKLGVDIYFSLR